MTKPSLKAPAAPARFAPPENWLARVAGQPLVTCLLLAAVTFAVFWPVTGFDFINCDDPEYVTANPQVLRGLTWPGVVWAFTTGDFGNWLPLTWLSHMLDVQLFGVSAAGAHFTSLLLHAANTILVYLLFRRMTGAQWRSAIVAALFAWHPLHVESVAWVAERRDVLCAFFGLLTLWSYAGYVRKAESRKQKAEMSGRAPSSIFHPLSSACYWLALFFFACGLMSKAMVVTLPFVLLLLDYWPLKRFQFSAFSFQLLLEKIPFLLLSVALSFVTYLTQSAVGAVSSLGRLSLADRVGNAFVSYARYLGKTFWPVKLALPYPHPGSWPGEAVLAAAALVAVLCVAALWFGRKRAYVATGWFWFFGMLIPAIGLIQTGAQAMADRFTYLPLIGVFVIVVWGAGELFARWRTPGKLTLTLLVLAGCVGVTRAQLAYWRNSETLFRHALAVTKNNYPAFNGLGAELARTGRGAEAIAAYRSALDIRPDHAPTLNNLGNALLARGQFAEAIGCFQAALSNPIIEDQVHNNLGNALAASGRMEEAIAQFQLALQRRPDFTDAHNNLGNALAMRGDLDGAIGHYREALRLMPGDSGAESNLGYALALQKKFPEALPHCQTALRLAPKDSRAHNNLGFTLAGLERHEEAVQAYQEALRLQPDYAQAHLNLGRELARLGRRDEAIRHFFEVLRLQPGLKEARQELRMLGVNISE